MRKGPREPQPLRITAFSPNCVMGAIEALARADGHTPQLNRLFFDYSFHYVGPTADSIGLPSQPQSEAQENAALGLTFARALPMERDEFEARLKRLYGIHVLHKGYDDFAGMVEDVATLVEAGQPVIAEIDLFHFPGQILFRTAHEGHVGIVTGLDRKAGTITLVDAFFGETALAIDQLQASFRAIASRRAYHLLLPSWSAHDLSAAPTETIGSDLGRSLANLRSPASGQGLQAFAAFLHQLESENARAGPARRPVLVNGFWTIMCNAMQNVRWLEELAAGSARSRSAIGALRKQMLWLNKRWFLLNAQLTGTEAAQGDPDLALVLSGLRAILAEESRTIDLIAAVEAQQGELGWRH